MTTQIFKKDAFTYYPNFSFWTNAKFHIPTQIWILANDTYNKIYYVSKRVDINDELGIENEKGGKSIKVVWLVDDESDKCGTMDCGECDTWGEGTPKCYN